MYIREKVTFFGLVVFVFLYVFLPAQPAGAYEVRVVNTSEHPVSRYPAVVDTDRLPDHLRNEKLEVTGPDGQSRPSQVDDLDGDGTPDELVFAVELDGGGESTFQISPGGSKEQTDLKVTEQFTVQNRHLRIRAVPATGASGQGLEVIDRRTGKHFLNRVFPERPSKRSHSSTRLLTDGPVRAVLEQSFRSGNLRYTYRYVLRSGRNDVRVRLSVTNNGDETASLKSLHGGFLTMDQGPLIVKNIRDLQVYSVNYWTTTRKNILWTNTSTKYGYGVSFHSPSWGDLGITDWAMPRRDPRGIQYHVVPSEVGEVTPTSRTWTVELDGKTTPGGIRDFVHDSGARALYRRSRWRRHQETPTVKPGRTRSFGLTLHFYRNGKEKALQAFEADDTIAPGVLNIHAKGKENVLAVSKAPYFFSEPFVDAGRWLTTNGANFRVRNGTAELTASEPGEAIFTPFTRDFMDPTELRGTVNLAGNTALKISLQDLRTGERYTVGTVTDDFNLLLSEEDGMEWAPAYARANKPGGKEHMRWESSDWAYGVRTAALRLELVRADGADSSGDPLRAELDHVEVAWISAEPPLIQSPPDDFELTDVAVSFKLFPGTWAASDRGYQVEVASDEDFNNRVGLYTVDNHQHKKHRDSRPRDCIPEELYDPGTYYCRARALQISGGHSPWSKPRRFTVGDTGAEPASLKRETSVERPLFMFIGGVDGFRKFYRNVPEKLRPYMAAMTGVEGLDVTEDGQALQMNGKRFTFPIVGRLGGHSTWGAADVASLEKFLAASRRAETGQFLGWLQGEGGRAKMKYNARYLKLAAKYGGLWGTDKVSTLGASRDFYDLLKTHSNHIFILYHRQNPYKPLKRMTDSIGAWLTGRIGRLAVDMQWHTPKKVIAEGEIRAVDWLQTYLVGLAYGAQLYTAETFLSDNPRWPQAVGFSPERDRAGEAWTRALKPFMTDVVEHDLIPTREEVLDRIRVAFQPRPEVTIETAREVEYYPYDVVNAVHGVPTRWHQWVPDNTRYTLVPMLPVLATEREKARFESVVDPYNLHSSEAAVNYMNLFYEPTPNEAFAVRAGDSGVITNYEEKPPGDKYWGSAPPGHEEVPVNAEPQAFYLSFPEGPVSHITGNVAHREYYLAKQYPDRFFVHSNYYRNKQSTFTLHGRKALSVRVNPDSALVKKKRKGNGKEMTLTVSHEHEVGAVRVIAE